MKLSIEKRPMNNEESYFVLSNGEKQFAVAVNAVKAAALIWVFLMAAIFSFIVGQQVQQTNVAITAYMLQGNVTDMSGNPVTCNAVLNEKKVIEWKCLSENKTVIT